MKVFSLYDSKACTYLQPYYAVTRGAGVRMMSDALADQDSHLRRHAADFTLFELGDFDQSNGCFELYDVHENLGVLQSLVVE
jgi:hypothetical protein